MGPLIPRRERKSTPSSVWVYFKPCESQIPVIDRAIKTAALMLGSDRSRGCCLEMICADLLTEAIWTTQAETLLFSMTRFFRLLPDAQRQAFLEHLGTEVT